MNFSNRMIYLTIHNSIELLRNQSWSTGQVAEALGLSKNSVKRWYLSSIVPAWALKKIAMLITWGGSDINRGRYIRKDGEWIIPKEIAESQREAAIDAFFYSM